MANVPLLCKVLEHIENHPEEWDQKNWKTETACGTAYCFAGHALVMMGHEILENKYYAPVDEHGTLVDVAAARELGLTTNQARDLFSPVNSLARLRELVAEYSQ
jgi:hypothetical protein